MMIRQLLRNDRGMSAVEFGLVAPLVCAFIIGIAQVGTLFYANAGLKSAVAEGARYATIHPKPTNAQIIARITDRRFGLDPTYLETPTISTFKVDNRDYVEIAMTYNAPVDFIFFKSAPVTMVERRKVFVYPT